MKLYLINQIASLLWQSYNYVSIDQKGKRYKICKRIWHDTSFLYSISVFMNFVYDLVFWIEHSISETGFMSVRKWKGRRHPHGLSLLAEANLSHWLIYVSQLNLYKYLEPGFVIGRW
jgi:hypothetical protein